MTLKKCTCGEMLTTKNVIRHTSRAFNLFWFTCKKCQSTMVMKRKTQGVRK